MRKKIISLIKNSDLMADIYYFIRMALILVLRLFCKQDPKLALFVSYGGKNASDSPKVIYDAMKEDSRFKDWTFVWGAINPEKFPNLQTVKMDSVAYFKTCLRAKVWITNSGITRYLDFKPKGNIFINTWHGIPMKKIGIDEVGVKKSKLFARKWFEFSKADVNLVCSQYDKGILKRVFRATDDSLKVWGLPRDDRLFKPLNCDEQEQIRNKLKIPSDKKVILYAPTVRGDQVSSNGKNYFNNQLDLHYWQEELSDYIILYRAHYYVDKIDSFDLYDNVIDVSHYDNLNDLMLISDLLISDYSSIVFDYSILERPIILYTYDLEEYSKYQGLYFDPRKYFNTCMTEKELVHSIRSIDYESQCSRSRKIKQEFYYDDKGNSTEKVLNYIYHNVK